MITAKGIKEIEPIEPYHTTFSAQYLQIGPQEKTLLQF